jgi:hypothetical protein
MTLMRLIRNLLDDLASIISHPLVIVASDTAALTVAALLLFYFVVAVKQNDLRTAVICLGASAGMTASIEKKK